MAVRLPAAFALQVELKAGDFLKAEIDKNENISLVLAKLFT
jgi:antitoxin component of MazEF toxin-antitoxin module